MARQFQTCVVVFAVLSAARPAFSAEPASPRIPEKPLPLQGVQQIAELPDGTMAFGSDQGLALWRDGKLKTFSGPTFAVSRLLAAKDGSLWVGSSQGLARLKGGDFEDVTQRVRESLPQSGEGEPKQRPLDVDVMSLFEASDGRIFIGMRYGTLVAHTPKVDEYDLISFDPELELEAPLNANNWIRCVAEDRERRLWTCIGGLGVFQIDSRQIREIPKKQRSWTKTQDPRAMCFDSQNNLWIGTPEGLERHGADGSRAIFTADDGLPKSGIEELHADGPGRIWITTYDGVCAREGNAFQYPVIEPDEDGAVATLFKSRDGTCWISDWNQVSAAKVEWVSMSPFERESERVKSQIAAEYPDVQTSESLVIDKRGRVWVDVRDRLLRYNGKEWTQLAGLKAKRLNLGRMKVDSRGRVLICSDRGLLIYEGDLGTVVGAEPGPDGNPVAASYFYDIAEGPGGIIYAGTQGGLFSLKGNELELLTTQQWYQALIVVVDSTGAVWFNDANAGLHRYFDGETTRFSEQIPRVPDSEIVSLAPMPERGVTVYAQSTSLTGVVLRAFEFDGEKVSGIRELNLLLGIDARDHPSGCLVVNALSRFAAAKARLAAGDVISQVNDRRLSGLADLNDAVGDLKPGDTLTLTVIRKKQPLTIKLVLPK